MVERKAEQGYSVSPERLEELAKLAEVETEGKTEAQIKKEIIAAAKGPKKRHKKNERVILYPRDMDPLHEAELRLVVRKIINEALERSQKVQDLD